jgi:iron complex transport system permease protein
MLANALLSLLTYISARQTEVRHMLFWAFGNLDKATWETLVPVGILMVFPLAWMFRNYQTWPFLLLDDAKGQTLGIRMQKVQLFLLLVVALLTGLVVSLAGPIGFVGMVVPFVTRKWLPVSRASFWPLTFLAGAVFLSTCDLLARILYMPFGLPVGLVSSLVGLPFFLYLLRDSGTRTDF